jgi:hypothetical protein
MAKKRHNLSSYQLLTGNMGRLYPIGLHEVLPGDVFRHATSVMVRLSPMAAPVMHPMTVRIHSFFVPHRLVWDGFEDFITGGPDGNDSQTVPQITLSGNQTDLGEYWTLPRDARPVSALPFRGYNAIFNEYFRDQDLVAERLETDQTVANVAWEKDYFTTARPWPQKGDAVTIPIGAQAEVKGDFNVRDQDGNRSRLISSSQTGDIGTAVPLQQGQHLTADQEGLNGLYADLSQATAVDVNDLRRAFALQRFQEARARYGSRYSEYLRHYGVRPADSRLDRPEYLGGGRVRVNVSEVLQTAPETGTPTQTEYGVGDLYGHGVGALSTRPYRRRFPEHGYVHTFLSVRPKALYTEQVQRTWLKKTKEDFFQKELQHIGQQPVWQGEIFAENDADTYNTFGWQDRYREYQEHPSQICGDFRDQLGYWHMGRLFVTDPVLNASFVECDPSNRIFNVQTEDHLWIMVQHRLRALRNVQRTTVGRIF